jgi:hypothetical protein
MQNHAILLLLSMLACIATTALADPTNVRLADAKPGTAPPSIPLAKPHTGTTPAARLQATSARIRAGAAMTSVRQQDARDSARMILANASSRAPTIAGSVANARLRATSARMTAGAAMTSVRQQDSRDSARMMLANAASRAPTIAGSAPNARLQATSARMTAGAAMTSVRQKDARRSARMMSINAASHAPTIARSAANRKGKGKMTAALRPKPNKSL